VSVFTARYDSNL